MAKYELNIYGKDDKIVKQHATNICPWGVYIQAAEIGETLNDKSAVDQMKAVSEILKMVFVDLTDDEIKHADAGDVMNTFMQIVNGGQKIKNGKNA